MVKILTSGEILKMYRDGSKDFTGIKATAQDFSGFNLSGICFKKADLSWSIFDNCILVGSDFSDTNLEWTSFRRADLKDANFANANISYSDISDAIVQHTNFQNANFDWSLAFNVNLEIENIKGARTGSLATHISQLSSEGMRNVIDRLKALGVTIPQELLVKLELEVKHIHEKARQLSEMKFGYMEKSQESSGEYIPRTGSEKEVEKLYDSFHSVYTQVVEYGMKQMREKEEHKPLYKKQSA